eukprot:maker-scaffold_15-snap-gene-0.27-mRNA-1 protein AED:0.01 eAED:0.01 QI:45/1/1/1/1/1/2/137/722
MEEDFDEADVNNTRFFVNRFRSFIQNFEGGTYERNLQELIQQNANTIALTGTFRFILDLSHILSFDRGLGRFIMKRPLRPLLGAQEALSELVPPALQHAKLMVGFSFNEAGLFMSPRQLKCSFIGSMVNIRGVVVKNSPVLSKLERATQYDALRNSFKVKTYADSFTFLPATQRLQNKNKQEEEDIILEEVLSQNVYSDIQILTVQETPEDAPYGQLPRSVEILVTDDLVNVAKPGDRCIVNGIYRPVNGEKTKTMVLATFIKPVENLNFLSAEDVSASMTVEDLQEIKEISKRDDVLAYLSKSVAPGIFGHEVIKKALLLLLIEGSELKLENGTHIRGDMNMLMIGDPSTAKSQFLRFLSRFAPGVGKGRCVLTTGRGSTGVGLTAAVVFDEYLKEKRLEAGAMVLADRGIVLIDEFDKMTDIDRVAIHEAMEQQSITISKAGIHCTLNARCSVVAAANPIYGMYDRTISPQKNVGLSDAILSRFDLVFIVLDDLEAATDRKIVEHIMKRRLGRDKEEVEKPAEGAEEILSQDFLQKYLFFSKFKARKGPKINEDVVSYLSEEYSLLRSETEFKTLPVTARLLETLFRLSVAHAKLRLSQVVEVRDAEEAVELVRYSLYYNTEVKAQKKGKRRKEVSTEIIRKEIIEKVFRETLKVPQIREGLDGMKITDLVALADEELTDRTGRRVSKEDQFNEKEVLQFLKKYERRGQIYVAEGEAYLV